MSVCPSTPSMGFFLASIRYVRLDAWAGADAGVDSNASVKFYSKFYDYVCALRKLFNTYSQSYIDPQFFAVLENFENIIGVNVGASASMPAKMSVLASSFMLYYADLRYVGSDFGRFGSKNYLKMPKNKENCSKFYVFLGNKT